jgi:hypothetical protein
MVLLDRIELSTSPLPMECSTTELQQRTRMGGHMPQALAFRNPHHLTECAGLSMFWAMANKPRTPRSTAEIKRLAEALRINLLKRKSLARLKKTIAKAEKKASD